MIWRKLLLAFLFIATLQTGYAQIAKGTIMAGGNLGFQFTTDNANHGSMVTFTFDPLFGGFVAKNVVLGIAPLVQYSKQSGKQGTYDIYDSKFSLGAGPFVRYYLKIGDKAYVYFHAAPLSLAGEWEHISKDASQPYYRTGTINWAIGPGISVMVAKGIALEVGAYYNGTWHRNNVYQNGNVLGTSNPAYVDNGMVLNVGIQVYFERNKKEKAAQK